MPRAEVEVRREVRRQHDEERDDDQEAAHAGGHGRGAAAEHALLGHDEHEGPEEGREHADNPGRDHPRVEPAVVGRGKRRPAHGVPGDEQHQPKHSL